VGDNSLGIQGSFSGNILVFCWHNPEIQAMCGSRSESLKKSSYSVDQNKSTQQMFVYQDVLILSS